MKELNFILNILSLTLFFSFLTMEDKEIKKLMVLPSQDYYRTHLSLINCILPIKMTPMEIEVLATFMSLEGDYAIYRFSPSSKKEVRKILSLSEGGLSNYMRELSSKGFISNGNGIIKILPILIPNDSVQDYRFRLNKLNN